MQQKAAEALDEVLYAESAAVPRERLSN